MIKTVLFSVLIIAIGMIFLGIKVLLKPKGEFTSIHIHDSQAMKDRGIHCVMDQDREDRERNSKIRKLGNSETRKLGNSEI